MAELNCVFCAIVAGTAPATVVHRTAGAVAIRPHHPVTPGHILVIPTVHVADVAADPAVSALTMITAAGLAAQHPACNVITSRGADATQTVFHLHFHVVPRYPGDGLALPWTGQKRGERT
jgi:histidine triad (HIT) family protein